MLYSLKVTSTSRDHKPAVLPPGLVVSATSLAELWPLVQFGRTTLRGLALRLVEEGAADLVGFDDACEMLSEITIDLEMNHFFLTPRRATVLLKDALFALDSGWTGRQLPRYEPAPPAGAPVDQYFRAAEAVELVGSTVRMRPDTPGADLARVGIVRTMQQIYPCQWILGLGWDHDGGAAFFDRKDFREMLIVVEDAFSSYSGLALWTLDNRP